MSTAHEPPLSMVIATLDGWPDYEAVFRDHLIAVDAVDGELVVIDGSDKPPPAAELIGPRTRWLSAPGEGVTQLRARGYAAARGAVVAVTEDHCRVEPDWASIALALHAEHPEAAVIGGVVENGSPGRLDDWAVFFIGHFRDMPGVGHAHPVAIAGLTNMTYKRTALARLVPIEGMGVDEAAFQRDVAARGEGVLIDDRLHVSHVQSIGLVGMASISWHAARAGAGIRRQHMTPLTMMRILGTPISPLVYGPLIAEAVARRRYAVSAFIVSVPVTIGILALRAVAEVVGYIAGPGDSIRRFP